MEYKYINQRLIDFFEKEGKEFPKYFSYPIYEFRDNNIYDLFIIFKDDKLDTIESITNSIVYLYKQNINILEDNFIEKDFSIEFVENDIVNVSNTNIKFDMKFSDLYSEIRKFVFQKRISKKQYDLILKIIYFYQNVLGESISYMYNFLGQSFYQWVKDVIIECD